MSLLGNLRKILFVITFIPLLHSCGSAKNISMFGSSSTANNDDLNDIYLFTILEAKMAENANYVSGFAASVEASAEHLAYRFVGKVSIKEVNPSKYNIVDADLEVLDGMMHCTTNLCRLSLDLKGVRCPEVTRLIGDDVFSIPCGERGVVHLVRRDSLLPSKQATVFRERNPNFEFFSLGPIRNDKIQALPFVAESHPLVFAVDRRLQTHPDFLEDLKFSLNYWNQAIGFEALKIDMNAPVSSAFAPMTSVIFFEECNRCRGDARAAHYADPMTGQILSGKIDVYPNALSMEKSERRNTLTHELGHVLGLAHNFAASEDFAHQTSGLMFTSVMDIGIPDLTKSLPYDLAAINWVYSGKNSEMTFKHCSDPQVLYVVGCDNTDTPSIRAVSGKQMAESMQMVLKIQPNDLRNSMADNDDGQFKSQVQELRTALDKGDQRWAFLFLRLADNYLGRTFINAHKMIALHVPEDHEARRAWLQLFNYTLSDIRAEYSADQRTFIKFAEWVVRERPINSSTIEEFVKHAGVETFP